MDPLTQGLLGAAAAQALFNRQLGRRTWLIGAAGGVLPDADVLIRSAADPLLAVAFHRQFTHSLAFIPIERKVVRMNYLTTGPSDARATFLFAHGAGGAMDTPFMNTIAEGLAARGIRVARFEFPYMALRREGKKSGAPDRQPVLIESWRRAIDDHGGGSHVFIGGKSLGGRIASMVADDAGVRGLICFGYPFHPPGKPQQLRTAHLERLRTPALILQGTRDPFGTPDEIGSYRLSEGIRVEWLPDGDHSFKPRRASGVTAAENWLHAVTLAGDFIHVGLDDDG